MFNFILGSVLGASFGMLLTRVIIGGKGEK